MKRENSKNLECVAGVAARLSRVPAVSAFRTHFIKMYTFVINKLWLSWHISVAHNAMLSTQFLCPDIRFDLELGDGPDRTLVSTERIDYVRARVFSIRNSSFAQIIENINNLIEWFRWPPPSPLLPDAA